MNYVEIMNKVEKRDDTKKQLNDNVTNEFDLESKFEYLCISDLTACDLRALPVNDECNCNENNVLGDNNSHLSQSSLKRKSVSQDLTINNPLLTNKSNSFDKIQQANGNKSEKQDYRVFNRSDQQDLLRQEHTSDFNGCFKEHQTESVAKDLNDDNEHFLNKCSLNKSVTGADFICDLCNSKFVDKEILMIHCKNHIEINKFISSECGSSPKSNVNSINKKGSVLFKCSHCLHSFSSQYVLIKHIESNHSSTKHNCSYCNLSFIRLSMLAKHINTTHRNKQYKCSQCSLSFPLKDELTRHMNISHEELKYQCSDCDMRFIDQFSLKVHISSTHNLLKQECPICHYSFTHVNRHLQYAHKLKKFDCPECGSSFPQKGSLMRHIGSVHNHIKHDCSQCDRSYCTRNSLARHIRNVHRLIRHRCSECGVSFNERYDLKAHIDIVHKNKRHKCSTCQSMFSKKSNLNRHIKLFHTDSKLENLEI